MATSTKTTEIAHADPKRYELLKYLSEVREYLYNQIDLANKLQPLFYEDISEEDKKALEMKLKKDVENMSHNLWLLDSALTKGFYLIRSGVSLEKAVGDFAINMVENPVSEIPKNVKINICDEFAKHTNQTVPPGPSAPPSGGFRGVAKPPQIEKEAQETSTSSMPIPEFEESTSTYNQLLKSFEEENKQLQNKLENLNKVDLNQVDEFWKKKSSSPAKEAMKYIQRYWKSIYSENDKKAPADKGDAESNTKDGGALGNILYPSHNDETSKVQSDHLRLPRITDVIHENQFYVEIQLDEPQPIDQSQIEQFIKIDQVPPQFVERIVYDFVSMRGEFVFRMLSMDDMGQRAFVTLKDILDHKDSIRRINIHHLDATGHNEIGVTMLERVGLNGAISTADHSNGNVSRVEFKFSFQKFDIKNNNILRR